MSLDPTQPPVAAGRLIGPWQATTVGGPMGGAIPVAGTRTSVYLRDGGDLVRMDATTERIEATRRVANLSDTVVVAGGRLWVPFTTAAGRVVLLGLDPRSLERDATIRLARAGMPGDPLAFTTDALGKRLYVGAGRTVFVVAARTGRILTRYRVPARAITSLAVTPDRTRLYVTWNTPPSATSAMLALDPGTGRARSAVVRFDDYSMVLTATAAGVWVTNGSGHTLRITFRPARHLARPARTAVTYGGGGFTVDSVVQHGVVWVSGSTSLACADARTGRVRARAKVPSPQHYAANINSLVAVDGHLFAYYLADAGPTSLLIELTPPAACR